MRLWDLRTRFEDHVIELSEGSCNDSAIEEGRTAETSIFLRQVVELYGFGLPCLSKPMTRRGKKLHGSCISIQRDFEVEVGSGNPPREHERSPNLPFESWLTFGT